LASASLLLQITQQENILVQGKVQHLKGFIATGKVEYLRELYGVQEKN
jgi:hypothetical protein